MKELEMIYKVKSEILGFDKIEEMELSEIDELFATLKSADGETSFTLVNPYRVREYSFDVPMATKALLDINESSKLLVYNVVVIQDPLDESTVNFLAPLMFNTDNATMAQVVLNPEENPDFGLAEPLKTFKS